MSIEKVRPIDRVLEIFYSFAAVPVLLGALFKITHTSLFGSANNWLYFGLGTEAVVFASFGLLYLLAPPKAVDEMGVPTRERSVITNGKDISIQKPSHNTSSIVIDEMLKEADISLESLGRLSKGFKNLEANVERISNASGTMVNTEEYAQKLQEATTSLTNINSFYNKLSETSNALINSADDAKRTQEQIRLLAQNLSKLNEVYGNMLTAMTVRNA